jgi:phosphosulfolactate synthase (CoM biosynthesis protein A)
MLTTKVESGQKQAVDIQIVNSSGQTLKRMNTLLDTGMNTIRIDATNIFSKGVYFLRVSNSTAGVRIKSFLKN